MNDLAQQIIGGIVRAVIAAVGGYIMAKGIPLTDTQLDSLVGPATVILIAGWSSIQKWLTDKFTRSIAVASAVTSVEQGTPVVVTVTPKGQDNVATKVSAEEANAAPSVPIDQRPLPAPSPA
jgi:hypothetical protein